MGFEVHSQDHFFAPWNLRSQNLIAASRLIPSGPSSYIRPTFS
jgi:hypothetical protein